MRDRTTKAERRTAKRGLAAWRSAAGMIAAGMIAAEIGDRTDLRAARRCGVGAMARRLRPRPKLAPTTFWFRGTVVFNPDDRPAEGVARMRFRGAADGDTIIKITPLDEDGAPVVAEVPPEAPTAPAPWGAWSASTTLNMTDVDPDLIHLMTGSPPPDREDTTCDQPLFLRHRVLGER